VVINKQYSLKCANIKYEWVVQELEMACVFAIKISIYIL
jgi:hypothetical protein